MSFDNSDIIKKLSETEVGSARGINALISKAEFNTLQLKLQKLRKTVCTVVTLLGKGDDPEYYVLGDELRESMRDVLDYVKLQDQQNHEYTNDNKMPLANSLLVDGVIPAHTECPYLHICTDRCEHTGVDNPTSYSCGYARILDSMEQKEPSVSVDRENFSDDS